VRRPPRAQQQAWGRVLRAVGGPVVAVGVGTAALSTILLIGCAFSYAIVLGVTIGFGDEARPEPEDDAGVEMGRPSPA
jgi:NhaP-type Na+/H+ or K+/H+ antiporter